MDVYVILPSWRGVGCLIYIWSYQPSHVRKVFEDQFFVLFYDKFHLVAASSLMESSMIFVTEGRLVCRSSRVDKTGESSRRYLLSSSPPGKRGTFLIGDKNLIMSGISFGLDELVEPRHLIGWLSIPSFLGIFCKSLTDVLPTFILQKRGKL